MELQEAFDAGFDAVKAYVDKSFASFEKRILALEARQPLRGEKGEDGAPGLDGKDGADGLNGKDAEPASAEAIQEAVNVFLAANPPAAGKDGADGKDGAPGEKGADGKDGADVVELLIDRSGELVASLSDGRTKTLGPVIGKDGAPGADGKDGSNGADGKDGLGFDDLDMVDSDDGLMLRFARGEVVKEFRLPVVIDRGVFDASKTYSKGDGVTWAGCFWIAQDTTEGKPDGGKGWRLAVKKGRDGRDGVIKANNGPAKVKI